MSTANSITCNEIKKNVWDQNNVNCLSQKFYEFRFIMCNRWISMTVIYTSYKLSCCIALSSYVKLESRSFPELHLSHTSQVFTPTGWSLYLRQYQVGGQQVLTSIYVWSAINVNHSSIRALSTPIAPGSAPDAGASEKPQNWGRTIL